MKKRKKVICLFLCICVLGVGCGSKTSERTQDSGQQAEENNNKENQEVKIGFSFDSFVIERWIRDRDVFVSTAKKLGASVNVQNANGSVQEQISQIQYLIDKNVDVLAVVAADCAALSDVMYAAKEKGIKTISYDRLILNGDSDLYVSFNNKAVGTLMGKELKRDLPDGGQIIMIQGAEEDNNVKLVYQGFMEELEGSNLEVVYEAHCKGWRAELAVDYLDEALEK